MIGTISIVTQLSHLSTWVHADNVVGGSNAILGALAYRLAKQRRLGFKSDSGMLRTAEGVLLFLVCATPVFQTLMGVDYVTDNPRLGSDCVSARSSEEGGYAGSFYR
ncbi:MAG TPA: hypothetical protein VN442_01545 [Bryobacteraceae bacterium]|nr:hypothetical protein [Bryobacteraceae bacterium]